MSAIQELAPFIDAYQGRIRKAKDTSGMTLDELIERSGVAESAVRRLYTGTQSDPKLYYSAAICKTLGLSLDELFGLEQPTGSSGDLQARNHTLEIENARLVAANESQRAQIKSTHTICYVLTFFCVLLSVSLVAYLLIDSQIKNAGLIQGGTLSVLAWAFIALISAAVISGGIAILRVIRKENRNEESQSPRS